MTLESKEGSRFPTKAERIARRAREQREEVNRLRSLPPDERPADYEKLLDYYMRPRKW